MPNIFSLLRGNKFCCSLFTTVLVCLDHVSLLVDTKELEALSLLHSSPVDKNGGVLRPAFPVVHNNFLCLDQVEGDVNVLATTAMGCLVLFGDQAYHCCVIGKLMMVLESCLAVQS